MDTDSFTSQMRYLVDHHALLDHKFFHRIRSGVIAPAELTAWALQDRHVSYMFPQLIGLIIGRIDVTNATQARWRIPLVENLWEEVGEGNLDAAHSSLMDSLLLSMGVPDSELRAPALPGTMAFIRTQFDLALSDPLAAGGAF